MKRRTFVKQSSMALLGGLSHSESLEGWCKKRKKKLGVQLYTVRDDMAASPEKTLSKLASIGYKEIESAGYNEGKYYGMEVSAFKKLLKDEGLSIPSGHTNTGANEPDKKATMVNDWERVVADAAAIGQKYMVCGYIHDFERKSLDDYKKLTDLFNRSGEICNKYGIQFCFHNHDFEFAKIDDQIPYDLMLERMDPTLANMELDMYWITKAGYDPLDYFKKYPGRFPLWHIKDMADTEEQFFTEVGNGTINFKRIFKEEKLAGMKYFYIEQDVCRDNEPLVSTAISYKNLRKMRY